MAAAYLRGLIFDGSFAPGTRIPQDRVAEALGVSRIPVREAIAMLAAEGRVTIERHRGAFVDQIDESSVHEAMELMNLLSEFVVRRAVEHKDESLIAELTPLRRRLRATRQAAEVDEIVGAIRELIFRAGTSPRVFMAIRQVLTLSPPNFCRAFPAALPTLKRMYVAVIDAIAAGDVEAAVTAMADGGHQVQRVVLDSLRKRGVVTRRH